VEVTRLRGMKGATDLGTATVPSRVINTLKRQKRGRIMARDGIFQGVNREPSPRDQHFGSLLTSPPRNTVVGGRAGDRFVHHHPARSDRPPFTEVRENLLTTGVRRHVGECGRSSTRAEDS